MKTPRLALALLLSLLAPAFAAAADGWTPKVQPGSAWTAIRFEDQKKDKKWYWFRSDAKGDAVPLYILTKTKNDSVQNSVYYTTSLSAYKLKITPNPRAYAIVGNGLSFPGSLAGDLGASAWEADHKGQPYKGGVTVVVDGPKGADEKLDPTPISVYTPGLAPVTWNEYYYSKEAREGHWYSDPDAGYRQAKLTYGAMHARVLPFEYLFDSDKCFVRPEACVDGKNPKYARFIEAAAEASKGNLLLVEPIAVEAHKYYADEAKKFKADLDKGPANAFTPAENKLLERLLVNAGMFPAFQAELRGLKTEQQPLFVKKWRGYLKAELDAYAAESAAAGSKVVAHAKSQGDMAARAKAASALALGAVPATKPDNAGKPGQPGKPGHPVKPGQPVKPGEPQALIKNPDAGSWNGAAIPVGDFFKIKTQSPPVQGMAAGSSLEFYCYHQKIKGGEKLAAHLDRFKRIAECTDWTAPADDKVEGKGAEQFKTRQGKFVFNVAVVDGALKVVSDKGVLSDLGGTVTELERMSAAKFGAPKVKATTSKTPEAPSSPKLAAEELVWLDRKQKAAYEKGMPDASAAPSALKSYIDGYRSKILENLAPDDVAIEKYKGAMADAKAGAAAFVAALPKEVWGGNVTEIVALFGANTPIQLTEAEWTALKALSGKDDDKNSKAAVYKNDRAEINGGRGDKFDKDIYDPIALHRTVMTARAALKAPPTAKPEDAVSSAPLNEAEMKLLTPAEKRAYEDALAKAKGGNAEAVKYLASESARLRKLIADEKRGASPAYAAPKNIDEFKKLDDWQKTKFCDPSSDEGKAIAQAGPKQSESTLNGADAKAAAATAEKTLKGELVDQSGEAAPQGAVAAKRTLPDWAKSPCAEHLAKTPSKPSGGDTVGRTPPPSSGIGGKITTGDDNEIKAKEKSKWITQDLMVVAAKGGMVGLLIGSLFGPIGLIAGPLIGAALFYGVTKLQE